MKVGDIVFSKDRQHKGKVRYVYPHLFVDVVWNCDSKNWKDYAAQKELKTDLITK